MEYFYGNHNGQNPVVVDVTVPPPPIIMLPPIPEDTTSQEFQMASQCIYGMWAPIMQDIMYYANNNNNTFVQVPNNGSCVGHPRYTPNDFISPYHSDLRLVHAHTYQLAPEAPGNYTPTPVYPQPIVNIIPEPYRTNTQRSPETIVPLCSSYGNQGSACVQTSGGQQFSRGRTHKRTKGERFCTYCQCRKEHRYMYMTHPLRFPNGETACPILINSFCQRCCQKGHRISHCPLIRAQYKY